MSENTNAAPDKAGDREGAIREFAKAILHGDDEHQSWLLEAAHAFIVGDPMPSARGKGAALTTGNETPSAGGLDASFIIDRWDGKTMAQRAAPTPDSPAPAPSGAEREAVEEQIARMFAKVRGHTDLDYPITTTNAGKVPVWTFYRENAREVLAFASALRPAPTGSGEPDSRAGVLWSAWSEDDCDSDPRIDPLASKVTEWFIGRWPLGAEEPECRILIGEGRKAEVIARRVAGKLTSILNTDSIRPAALQSAPIASAAAGPVEEEDALYKAFKHADDEDWKYILSTVGFGGRARFWHAVLTEARAALATPTPDPHPVPAKEGR